MKRFARFFIALFLFQSLLMPVMASRVPLTNVGGNLSIASIQDTSTYLGQQSSSGGSISVGLSAPSIGGGISAGRASANTNYQSVNQQSGIQAGDGGFQVNVKGSTTLTGAVIASTQAAVDSGVNRFASDKLTLVDLQNTSNSQTSASQVGVGYATGIQASANPNLSAGKPNASLGYDSSSSHASSTTRSGISGIAGNTAVRTGNSANALAKPTSGAQLLGQVQAGAAITASFGQVATTAVGNYADSQMKSPDNTPEQQACWAEGGACRAGLHAVVGGLTGGVQGALGAGVSQAVIPQIGDLIARTDLPDSVKQSLMATAGTLIGAGVGGAAGAAAAGNATVNNYLNHTDASRLAELNQKCKSNNCTSEERKARDALIQKDNDSNAQLAACAGSNSASCQDVRANFNAGAASYLPSAADVKDWAQQQADKSGDKYTAGQIEDAYNASILGKAPTNTSSGDLSPVADWVRGQIKEEPPLSKIAMGWAQSNNGNAAGVFATNVQNNLSNGGRVISGSGVGVVKSAVKPTGVNSIVGDEPLQTAVTGSNGLNASNAPNGSTVGEVAAEPITSGGTANAATAPQLKGQLSNQNLANIAAQDPRLAAAVQGSGVINPNFSIGSGTAADANRLGAIWVGDGATPMNGVPGGLVSADGTRVYRPPTEKPNTPAQFNPTGTQANFVTQTINPNTGKATIIGNGHMVIAP